MIDPARGIGTDEPLGAARSALQGFAITGGIPILLFAWILRTALVMPRRPQ